LHWFLTGLYQGVPIGAQSVSDYQYIPPFLRDSGMWMSHADPYYLIGFWIPPITWSLIAFVLLKILFERGWITKLVALVPLGTAIFTWAISETIRREFIADPEPYLNPLRQSNGFSTAVLLFLSAGFILQIATLVLDFRNKPSQQHSVLP